MVRIGIVRRSKNHTLTSGSEWLPSHGKEVQLAGCQTFGRMRPPVFIVGCPRSGTSFLYHLLLSGGGFASFHTHR
jgi:hypothetical protein